MVTIKVIDNAPEFTFDVYFSEIDGVPVLCLATTNMQKNEKGPVCRVYLNDAVIFENPQFTKN